MACGVVHRLYRLAAVRFPAGRVRPAAGDRGRPTAGTHATPAAATPATHDNGATGDNGTADNVRTILEQATGHGPAGV